MRPAPRLRPLQTRSLVVVATTVVLLVLASGCFRAAVHLELSSDNRVTGDLLLAVDDQVARQFGMSGTQMWEEVAAEAANYLPPGVSREPYSSGGFTGSLYQLPTQSIGLLRLVGGEQLQVTRAGEFFTVNGHFDLTQGIPGAPSFAAQQLLDQADMRISVTFPGEVVETNGQVRGTTVEWTLHPQEPTEVFARGYALVATGADDDAAGNQVGSGGSAGQGAGGSRPTASPASRPDRDRGVAWYVWATIAAIPLAVAALAFWVRRHSQAVAETEELDEWDRDSWRTPRGTEFEPESAGLEAAGPESEAAVGEYSELGEHEGLSGLVVLGEHTEPEGRDEVEHGYDLAE